MSARDKIAGLFPGEPHLGLRVADDILADHARELAAAIRFEASSLDRPYELDWEWAADLIDPDEEA